MKKIEKHFKTQYVGQTQNFQVEKGAYLHKQVCGCGITHFLLTNDENVIVAVPTNSLIKNKVSQLQGLLGVNGETSTVDIDNYVHYKREGQIKIMVTYDSIYKVEHLIGRCRLIIDEVQSFFKNYNTKTDITKVRNLYRTTLSICEKYKDEVTFVSATPIPVEYFPQWVQELKQVNYNFEYTYKRSPILSKVSNPMKSLVENIIKPIIKDNKVTIQNKTFSKCLIFVNSVTEVINLIKDNNFDVDLFGVYCGDTAVNDSKLAEIDLTRFTGIWDLPQFAFVTKSGFEGVDFYSKEHFTIVVSQCKKDYQMVDINTDLVQAVARLRNEDNPNRDKYLFLYNQSAYTKSEEELLTYFDKVKQSISNCCESLNREDVNQDTKDVLLKDAEIIAYTVLENDIYCIDEVAFSSKVYQIKEVRSQFFKGFDLSLGEDGVSVDLEVSKKSPVSFSSMMERMANGDTFTDEEQMTQWYQLANEYWELFHSTTTNAQFAITRIEAERSHYTTKQTKLELTIQSKFNTYVKYSAQYVKQTLQEIYNALEIKRKAKASDMMEFAECENKTMSIDGYKTKGIIINRWKTNLVK